MPSVTEQQEWTIKKRFRDFNDPKTLLLLYYVSARRAIPLRVYFAEFFGHRLTDLCW